jgi:catechol 2,3-dioxygenase
MKQIPKLNHFGIFVYNIDQMTKFYKDLFGLVETDRGAGRVFKNNLVFLSGDPEKHHQLVLVSGRKGDTPSTVMQISFIVDSLDDLREMNEKAKNFGVSNLMSLNHGNAWSIYFDDPEGNKIEVYTNTPFHTPQPCGEPLDLSLPNDELLAITKALVADREGGMTREAYVEQMTKVLGG